MQHFRYLFLASLLILLSATVRAQSGPSISGNLEDPQRLPIPFATVMLKKPDSTSYLTTLSDEKGHFRLAPVQSGSYLLEVSMMGFEKISKQVDIRQGDSELGILTMQNAVTQLKGVTIRADAPLIDRQTDKTVINLSRNMTSEGATVLELMKKLPGVRIGPDGRITMNGKPGVNILIDGKPTYLSSEDLGSLLGSMSATTIQKIELMSNPSSKYDAAGTGGMINIIKKKNQKEGLSGTANGSFAQSYYSGYNGGFSLAFKNQHYHIFTNHTYLKSQDFLTSALNSRITDANNNLVNVQVSKNERSGISRSYRPTWGIDLYLSKRTTLTLSGNVGAGTSGNAVFSRMDVLDSAQIKARQIRFTSQLKDRPFNATAGMQLAHQLDTTGTAISFDFDYSTYRNVPVQVNLSTQQDAEGHFRSETDNLLNQRRRLDIYSSKIDFTRPLSAQGSFEAGLKTSYVKANNDNLFFQMDGDRQVPDPSQSDRTLNSENINAAYLNLNKTFNKLTIQAGLRAEQTVMKGKERLTGIVVHRNYVQLFPTLFLRKEFRGENILITRLGRRTERPDYRELVPFRRPQSATLFFQGNPFLRPQTSWHGEFSWSWKSTLTVTLNYDLFANYIRTLPFLDSNQTTLTRRPINMQGARTWESDWAYTRKLSSWWTTNNSIVIYRSTFRGEVNGYSLNNPGMVSTDITAGNIFQIGSRFSAEAELQHSSKRKFATSTFGGYYTLSLGAKHQFLGQKASVSLNIYNLLQSENYDVTDLNLGLYQHTYFKRYSRRIGLNFSYRFGSGKPDKTKRNGTSDEQKRAAM